MDPRDRARAEYDVRQFKEREAGAEAPPDRSAELERLRACVFAHSAFALLDQAIAEQVAFLLSESVPVGINRKDTTIVISLGLRRAVYDLKLSAVTVGIVFAMTSPSTRRDKALFAMPWPAEVVPLEQLRAPIGALVDEMRAFLLHGEVPANG